MEDLLKQILNKLQAIENHMGNLATRQEVKEEVREAVEETKNSLIEEMKRVADTLETIAVGEASVAKEEMEVKMEAGDVILKSFIDGLESRTNERFDRLEKQLEEIKTALNEGFKSLGEAQQKTAEILNVYLSRFEYQDEINNILDEKIKKQEETTYFIRRDLKELKDKVDKLTGDAS